MAESIVWRILCVDDDPTITSQVKEFFDGEPVVEGADDGTFEVDVTNDFHAALGMLETTRYDAMILDLRLGDAATTAPDVEAGEALLRAIQARRFLPVIFFTGLPGQVEGQRGTLVRVVEKTESVDRLLEEVRGVFEEGLPRLNRLLIRHVEEVQRDYMWSFVARNWERISGGGRDGTELAYLLGRRLAASLTEASVVDLAVELGGGGLPPEGRYHAVRVYLMPPLSPVPMPGELLRSGSEDSPQYRLLLTPACDMVQNKAEFVLVARCVPLESTDQHRRYVAAPSNTTRSTLRKLLQNNLDRYYFLPAAIDVPDLIVDFQQLETFECQELDAWTRIAALDSPFGQAILSQFTRYFSRLGTPDIDVDAVIARIDQAPPPDGDGTPYH